MKKFFYIFLLSSFLVSCANFSSLNATVTPQVTLTFTPTFAPTTTPTITPIPTETPDPNMPSDATGKDPSTGEYIKAVEENGKTVVYIWKQFQFGDDVEKKVKGHWFESRIAKGSIDLTGYGENYRDTWGKISLKLNVYSIEGLRDLDDIGYLYHPEERSDYIKNGLESDTLASNVAFDLFRRYSGLIPDQPKTYYEDKFTKFREKYYSGNTPTDAEKQKFFNDWQTFVSALNNGDTIEIENEIWEPRMGYDVYIIDEATAAKDTSMHLNVQGYTMKDFYWKIFTNDEKLIAVIAPAKLSKEELTWRDAQRRERHMRFLVLFPLQAVLTTENLSDDIRPYWYQDYAGMAGPDTFIRTPTKSVTITTSFIDFMPNP